MKRVIIAAVMLVSTMSVFAAGENEKGKLGQQNEWKADEAGNIICSVAMEGSVSLVGVSVKVTCTASAGTCKEAIAQAAKCLEEARKLLLD